MRISYIRVYVCVYIHTYAYAMYSSCRRKETARYEHEIAVLEAACQRERERAEHLNAAYKTALLKPEELKSRLEAIETQARAQQARATASSASLPPSPSPSPSPFLYSLPASSSAKKTKSIFRGGW